MSSLHIGPVVLVLLLTHSKICPNLFCAIHLKVRANRHSATRCLPGDGITFGLICIAVPLRQLLRHFCIAYSIPQFCRRTNDTIVLGFIAGSLPNFMLLDVSFTAVKIHVAVFGVMTPCSLIGGYKPFGQKVLHL